MHASDTLYTLEIHTRRAEKTHRARAALKKQTSAGAEKCQRLGPNLVHTSALRCFTIGVRSVFRKKSGDRPTANVRLTFYTHCYTCPTRATHLRIHAECTSAPYTTQTHTRRRGRTHTARVKPKNKLAAAHEKYQTRGSNPGLHGACQRSWPLGHITYGLYCAGGRLRSWPPHGKTQGNVGKTQYKNLWAAPPPLAEVDYTRMLDDTHARMRVHTHTRHKLTIQTRLYTTNNSKQGLNSIHTLPMVPNTTKLRQNSTTTTEHNGTSRSSTQTNTSALTKALKRSKKQERSKQQKPNNKELENTKTKP